MAEPIRDTKKQSHDVPEISPTHEIAPETHVSHDVLETSPAHETAQETHVRRESQGRRKSYERRKSHEQHLGHNLDSVLDPSHEHVHAHLHHSPMSVKGRRESITYSRRGSSYDKSDIPDQSPLDDDLHRRHHPERHPEKSVDLGDEEKGSPSPPASGAPIEEEEDQQKHRVSRFYAKYRWAFHIFIWLFFTGWWIAGLILHVKGRLKTDHGWLIPFLLWLIVTLRLVTFYLSISYVMKPLKWLWRNTASRFVIFIPEKARIPLGAALVIAVILIGAMASPESADNTRQNRAVSIFGLLVFIFVLWVTSRNRKAIKWHTVIVGMLVQFIIAIFVLRSKAGYDIFSFISMLARSLLGFASQGTAFLTTPDVAALHWFLIGVIPAIIFFVALVQLLYYYGFIQWFIGKFAVFFFWSMRVSGAEAVVAAASPFIGQGESAMLIRPFIPHMTMAEIHQVMTSGFATIAGSVLVAYLGMGINGQALISSCVMSIPASLAVSKIRFPETEETLTNGRVVIPDDDEHKAANGLHAFANGAWLGLKIGGMIIATLLCILALLGLLNGVLTWWGYYLNINDPPLTIELLVGYICYPIAFLLGVPRNGDLLLVGELIGTKIIANEFVAFSALQTDPRYKVLSPRSRLIATYALCGFGNIGSLGTQIGVLSQLAPSRSGDVSRVAVSALLSGVISTLTSASIAGLLVTDQAAFTSTMPS